MWLRKGIAVLVLLSCCILFCIPAVAVQDTSNSKINIDINSESAVLMDASTGELLYKHNPHKKWYPASMTKLMTLIVTLEAVHDGKASFDDTVVTSHEAAGYGGSQLWLEPQEKMKLWDMLAAIMVGSANDASVAVAEHIAGSKEAFVDMMNKKAEEIGCKNTHFTNSHGLHDEEHYTTAADMAKIARYSLQYPETLKLTSIKHYKFRDDPPTERYNLNKLLWWYPGTDGLKTGTTTEAKRNLAATCKKNGLRLISVVMGVDEKRGHFTETMKLYNAGFKLYTFKEFFPKDYIVGEVEIGKGAQDTVKVKTKDMIGLTVLKGNEENFKTQMSLPALISAPVKKGQQAGEIIVLKNGEEIKRFPLVVSQSVERGSIIRMIGKVFEGVFTLEA